MSKRDKKALGNLELSPLKFVPVKRYVHSRPYEPAFLLDDRGHRVAAGCVKRAMDICPPWKLATRLFFYGTTRLCCWEDLALHRSCHCG